MPMIQELTNWRQRKAALVTCCNEEWATGEIANASQPLLPSANIYLTDNDSIEDATAGAQAVDAIIYCEDIQLWDGFVRKIFSDMDAGYYVIIESDATYCAAGAPELLSRLRADNQTWSWAAAIRWTVTIPTAVSMPSGVGC